jgi:hypothetical protein
MRNWLSIVFVGLAGLAMLAACGGDGTGGPYSGGSGGSSGSGGLLLDCSTLSNPPADCDKACGSDSECTASYCNNDKCVANCTAEEGCGAGSTCNTTRGRCVPDVGTGGTGGTGNNIGCQSIEVTPSRSVPNVMFLVDQSGSMTDPFSTGQNRWQAAHSAITQIISELDSIVRFGLTTYQSNGGGSTPDECPIFDTQVGFALDNFSTISMSYPASFPGGNDTPTGDSIDVLVDIIQSDPPPADGPTIIVLATDGEPDSCEVPNPNPTAGARAEAVAASGNAHDAGIDVFVLWVGQLSSSGTKDHLKEVANVGVGIGPSVGVPVPSGEDPANPTEGAPFWIGNDPASLEAAFQQIISASISCEIEIDKPFNADTLDQACEQGDVRLNGTPLECPTDWRVKDEAPYKTIELLGTACETLKGGEVTFTAEFPCGTIVVE